jgi:molybdopterin synthase catalytic subunit
VLSAPTDACDWVVLTDAELPVDGLHAWAATPSAGAVVTFVGVVRDHAEGREGVHAMTYEAYEEPAQRVMHEIVADARRRWTDLERVALLHRVGRLELSEPSVAVAVSAPHRDHAFDAARYCIDTLKETAPIWKQEHWSSGTAWARGEHPIRPVDQRVAASATNGKA